MIEATCSACGTVNRLAEADVPVGAKFVPCTTCKSRVALPASALPAASALPPLPKPPAPKVPNIPPIASKTATPPAGLPTPKLPRPPSASDVLADLPAPKRTSALGDATGLPSKAAPKSGLAAAGDLADLPAPKPRSDLADLPAPKRGAAIELDDLLAPTGAPLGKKPRDVSDLPAPKPRAEVSDLPAPKARRQTPPAGMPAAKKPLPADLPTPKHPANLPTPKQPSSGIIDLPAPKGFFDDLPAAKPVKPAPQTTDLAPKGFFDDLPQPALNKPSTDLAPKGFFDDLPQPATQKPSTDLAPKGFFDDLPGPTTQRPSTDLAPKGFFDDLPGPARNSGSLELELADAGPALDLDPGPSAFEPPPESPADRSSLDLDLGTFDRAVEKAQQARGPDQPFDQMGDLGSLDLEDAPKKPAPQAPAARDFGHVGDAPAVSFTKPTPRPRDPTPPPPAAGGFDDLDLSSPTASPVRFEQAKGSQTPAAPRSAIARALQPASDVPLELESERMSAGPSRLGPKRAASGPAPAAPRRTKLVLGIALGVAAAGGGGFFLYQRHAKAQARAAEIAKSLGSARKAAADTAPGHWQQAFVATNAVLARDPHNGEALAIGAESIFAGWIFDGQNQAQLGRARQMIADAVAANAPGQSLARAQALSALAGGQTDTALAKLKPLAAANPKDGTLALYVGWAQLAAGDAKAAAAAFDQAIAAAPALEVDALYGRGRAKLAEADLDGARADFAKVLEKRKDHIGAQVGIAAAEPAGQHEQQESDLLAVLARKDIATADPRAVALANDLAGDLAQHAGRLDVARDRYKAALAAMPSDLDATAGLAETELRDHKLNAASELAGKALAIAKDDVRAQLVQANIEIGERQFGTAATRLGALGNHVPPLGPLDAAHQQLLTGRLAEAQHRDEEAVEAYERAATLAGDLDLEPTLTAVGKLNALAKAAGDAKDTKNAADLRGRADALLQQLADHAQADPQTALTLGVAYLEAGDAAKAEPWLAQAKAARPSDADALYQYGRAEQMLGKRDEAVASFVAATKLDATRADIELALARTYDEQGNAEAAAAAYKGLLAGKAPTIEARAYAGQFFVRAKQLELAAAQGDAILAEDGQAPAGYYLRGEGLLAQGKFREAKQAFDRAVEIDREALYLEAVGRAAEALAGQTGDHELQDTALRSYLAATELDPTRFAAWKGEGRLYVIRHEAVKAIAPLEAANKLDPRDAEVAFAMGAAYKELGQPQPAIQWLQTANRIAPSAMASWALGQIYRDQNQLPQASGALGQATRLGLDEEKATGKTVPWLTEALYALGRVDFDQHDELGARAAWEKYVGRSPPPSAQLSEVKRMLATQLRQ
ncbi:MAG TPA: tetratricopeptide repeat protein [Kofleriaceae bacterium]|jgi:tetratricopeptide (TPR) repeat protein